VRREEDRRAGLVEGLDGGLEKLPPGEGVETPRGFVEEQQLGPVAESAKQRDLPSLALGKSFDSLTRAEVETFDEPAGHLVVPRSEEGAVELDYLVHLEEAGENLVFGHETDAALDLDGSLVGIVTEDLDRSPLLVEHPHSNVDEGGLAGAVAAEESDNLAGLDGEVHAFEHGDPWFERSVNV